MKRERRDSKGQSVLLVLSDPQELKAKPEQPAKKAKPEPRVKKAKLVLKEPLAKLARRANLANLAHPDYLASPDYLEKKVKRAKPAKLELLANRASRV